jgi:hypothetical protein
MSKIPSVLLKAALRQQKGVPKLLRTLESIFNKFIRLRDTKGHGDGAYFKCISCGEIKPVSQMNAGH